MKNDYYVYVHYKKGTDIPFYVGKGRWNRINKSSDRNKWWKNIVNKYGFVSEKIEENLNEIDSLFLEQYWISQFKQWGFKLTNMTEGGEGISGYKHKKDFNKGVNNAFYGKIHTDESRKKMGKLLLNLETGIFYDSLLEASIYHDIKYTTLSHYINRTKQKTNLRYV